MRLGGLLGAATEVCTVDLTLRESAQKMYAGEVGSMGVVAGAGLIGIFTERDLMKAVARGADVDRSTVGDWMTTSPDTFSPLTEVAEAAVWLLETGYRHLPVVDDDRLLGILSMRDVLAALVEPGGEE